MVPPDNLNLQGALEFALYFIRTIDWAYAAQDSRPLRAASDLTQCVYCLTAADRTDREKAEGKYYQGGRVTVTGITQIFDSASYKLAYIEFTQSQIIGYLPSGQIYDQGEEKSYRVNVRIARIESGWRIVDFKKLV